MVCGFDFDVAHDLGKGVPFNLRERQEQMLVRQQGMFPPTCFLDGAVDNPLRGISNLAGRDIEIFYVHAVLRRMTEQDAGQPETAG